MWKKREPENRCQNPNQEIGDMDYIEVGIKGKISKG